MKILQINASYKPAYIYGGPTMSVSKLSETMAAGGVEVQVFTTTANGPTELDVQPGTNQKLSGVSVTYFKRLTGDHTHFSPALLLRLWREVKSFDVVHIHAWWNLVSVLSCWIAQIRHVPVIVSPRGTLSVYSFSNKNSLSKRILHRILGLRLLKKSVIHVTSDSEKRAMEALIRPKQLFNIPNFIKLPDQVSAPSSAADSSLKLIFLSRVEEKKGLEILFNALAAISIPYHLTIAGDGDPDYVSKLRTLATGLNLDENISWLGFVQSDKFDVLEHHDLMVLPSYDENFGNVVIESLSVGTAVLISKHVGLADYVDARGLGWVSEHDAASFADFITLIYRSPEKLLTIREQAPALVRNDFDDEKLALRYKAMYNKLLNYD